MCRACIPLVFCPCLEVRDSPIFFDRRPPTFERTSSLPYACSRLYFLILRISCAPKEVFLFSHPHQIPTDPFFFPFSHHYVFFAVEDVPRSLSSFFKQPPTTFTKIPLCPTSSPSSPHSHLYSIGDRHFDHSFFSTLEVPPPPPQVSTLFFCQRSSVPKGNVFSCQCDFRS